MHVAIFPLPATLRGGARGEPPQSSLSAQRGFDQDILGRRRVIFSVSGSFPPSVGSTDSVVLTSRYIHGRLHPLPKTQVSGEASLCYTLTVEKTWREFDSFEEADAFTEHEQLQLSPEERIELCIKISMAGWQLHHGALPEKSMREHPIIRIADVKDQDNY